MIEQYADKKPLNIYDYFVYKNNHNNLMLYRRNKSNDKIEYMIEPKEDSEENCFFGSFIELLLFKNTNKHKWVNSTVSINTIKSVNNFTYIGDLND